MAGRRAGWRCCSWRSRPPWRPATRKHEPRTLAEQRTVWRAEAVDTLGGPERIDAMIDQVLNPAVTPMPAATPVWRARTADRVLAALEEHRATWQFWHLWAETQRQLRGADIHPADLREVAAVRDGGGGRPVGPAHPGRRPRRRAARGAA